MAHWTGTYTAVKSKFTMPGEALWGSLDSLPHRCPYCDDEPFSLAEHLIQVHGWCGPIEETGGFMAQRLTCELCGWVHWQALPDPFCYQRFQEEVDRHHPMDPWFSSWPEQICAARMMDILEAHINRCEKWKIYGMFHGE